MSIWFDDSKEIQCSINKVKRSFDDLGEHYRGVVSLMPGLVNVELIEQGSDFVIIKTNEGLMKRTNITKTIEDERIILEFDEEYQAGSRANAKSHFRDEFVTSEAGIRYHTVISNVQFPGFLGFLYRKFGSRNIGNAFLNSYKTYLEKLDD